MAARVKRTVGSLLGMLALFWVYRLVAEPLIELPVVEKRVASVSAEQREAARKRQFENRLGNYMRFFPEGAWERDNPIVVESGSAKLLLKEYTSRPDGRLEVTPCTVILLPQGEAAANDNRKRVIILQAPQGAILQFDEPVDLSQASVSRLTGVSLEGPITIYSGPTRPEGGDDLYATTHDVQMNDNLVSTPNEVDFRFGASHGHGRDMQIELLPGQERSGKRRGPNIGGIQTFKLLRDVEMHLQPNPSGGQGGGGGVAIGGASQAPIDIRCQGHFEFDMVEYVARFHDQVDVLRPNASGPDDQLNCELLSIFFGRRGERQGADEEKSAPSGRRSMMPQLEPRRIEARGRPVVVRTYSVPGEARGERLDWDIPSGRILLEASEGKVRLESPQLSAEVSRLEAWLSESDESNSAGGAASESRRTGGGRGANSSTPQPPRDPGAPGPRQHFAVSGGVLQVALATRGGRTAVEHVRAQENVLFVQSPTVAGGPSAMQVRGDQLEALRVNGPDAEAAVVGQPAQVAIQGLTLAGSRVQLNRASNRMWIDGSGRMTVDDARAAANENGQTAAWAGRGGVTVDWQGGMKFDGRIARFERSVVGRRGTQSVQTELLDVQLRNRFDFGAARPRQQPQVELMRCGGPTVLENRELNGQQLSALDRLLVRDLTVNQITGELSAPGPGRALSWRIGQPLEMQQPLRTPGTRAPTQQPAAVQSDRDGINFVGVQFQGEMTGNTLRRELTFHRQVQCVYGPAPAWEAELNAENPDKLAPGSILMNTDSLKVYEMGAPVGGRAPVEMMAEGNTNVEGQRPEGDTFFASAHQLSYTQAKDLLVLKGDGRTDAQLYRQTRPGATPAKTAARTILYWRTTNRVELGNAQYLDLSSFGPARSVAPRP